jgi:hypothetical protein
LNASDCPPHNVLHENFDYPLYYDLLYFPQDHSLLFQTEESVCAWLLSGLQQHSSICASCPSSDIASSTIKNDVQYNNGFFNISFSGVRNIIPICDVESSCFSFCRLGRQILTHTSQIETSTTQSSSIVEKVCLIDAKSVLHEIPCWLIRHDTAFSNCLFQLPVSKLGNVVHSLAYAYPCSKSQLIQTIISDVYDQHQQFLCLSEPTLNFNLYIIRFFQSRYGNDVASTLCDL